jgi:hypothetical protein
VVSLHDHCFGTALRGTVLSSVSHNNLCHASVGIGLFTHHNYRKRLESDIPLDSHGQPLETDDSGGLGPGSIALRDSYPVGHGNGGTSAVRLWYLHRRAYLELSDTSQHSLNHCCGQKRVFEMRVV